MPFEGGFCFFDEIVSCGGVFLGGKLTVYEFRRWRFMLHGWRVMRWIRRRYSGWGKRVM